MYMKSRYNFLLVPFDRETCAYTYNMKNAIVSIIGLIMVFGTNIYMNLS